jgi:hypothetical protein
MLFNVNAFNLYNGEYRDCYNCVFTYFFNKHTVYIGYSNSTNSLHLVNNANAKSYLYLRSSIVSISSIVKLFSLHTLIILVVLSKKSYYYYYSFLSIYYYIVFKYYIYLSNIYFYSL